MQETFEVHKRLAWTFPFHSERDIPTTKYLSGLFRESIEIMPYSFPSESLQYEKIVDVRLIRQSIPSIQRSCT